MTLQKKRRKLFSSQSAPPNFFLCSTKCSILSDLAQKFSLFFIIEFSFSDFLPFDRYQPEKTERKISAWCSKVPFKGTDALCLNVLMCKLTKRSEYVYMYIFYIYKMCACVYEYVWEQVWDLSNKSATFLTLKFCCFVFAFYFFFWNLPLHFQFPHQFWPFSLSTTAACYYRTR